MRKWKYAVALGSLFGIFGEGVDLEPVSVEEVVFAATFLDVHWLVLSKNKMSLKDETFGSKTVSWCRGTGRYGVSGGLWVHLRGEGRVRLLGVLVPHLLLGDEESVREGHESYFYVFAFFLL